MILPGNAQLECKGHRVKMERKVRSTPPNHFLPPSPTLSPPPYHRILPTTLQKANVASLVTAGVAVVFSSLPKRRTTQ